MSHLYRGRGTGRDIPLSMSAHLIWVVNAPDDWPCTSHHLVDEADNPYLLLSIPPVQSIGWFPESLKAPYGHISSMHPPLEYPISFPSSISFDHRTWRSAATEIILPSSAGIPCLRHIDYKRHMGCCNPHGVHYCTSTSGEGENLIDRSSWSTSSLIRVVEPGIL